MATEDAPRDNNFVPAALFEKDGVPGEVMPGKIDESTGRILVASSGGGSGTVTSVSVATANGFAGTVANATTTPAITISTTITGIIKGDGTAISAATAGTDYTALAFKTISVSGQSDIVADTAADTLTIVAGTNITLTTNAATDTLTINAASAPVPTTITVANEATDTSCFIAFFTAATGDLGPKTNVNMTFNSNTGVVTFASSVLTTTDINGGTVDGTVIGGASAAAGTFTTHTSTNLLASSNDSGAIGASGTAFSDLFLASGAVINFSAGNVALTHSSGILTQTAGELRITSANVGTNGDSVPTLSSTSTFTNKTLTSPTLTTPSAFTTGGTITLAENTSIALDPAGSADGKWTGVTITGTAGYTAGSGAFGDLITLDKDDSRWEKVDISVAAAATGDARGILGMMLTDAPTDGSACNILLYGVIRADANFPALTIGAAVYASTTGDIVVAQPSTVDYVIRLVGSALTADEIYFNPDNTWITHT